MLASVFFANSTQGSFEKTEPQLKKKMPPVARPVDKSVGHLLDEHYGWAQLTGDDATPGKQAGFLYGLSASVFLQGWAFKG